MRYFIVGTTIRDGEFEYFSQSPVEAKNEAEAVKLQAKDAKEWTEDTYRAYEIDNPREISEAEYKIIKKYIY